MDIVEKSKQAIIEAKQPFDNALKAIVKVEENRDDILRNFIEVLKFVYPEGENWSKIKDMYRDGTMPMIVLKNGTLRIDGKLNTENSLVEFLKENTK